MARARFVADYNYTPSEDHRVSIDYKAGRIYDNVRRECVDQAVALGRAVELPARRRRSAA